MESETAALLKNILNLRAVELLHAENVSRNAVSFQILHLPSFTAEFLSMQCYE